MTYLQHNKLAISLLLGLFASNANAQDNFDLEDLYADDEYVSIATGTSKSIRLAPSVASVITAQDIENAGAIEIEQVLEMVPGLHISRSPINRLNTVFSIRGVQTTNNAQIVLLLDGVEVVDQFNSSRINRLKIPVSSIQRIEVIRGPGSALHGADAFAGVINIITKSASDVNGTEVSAIAGSFDTYGAAILHGGELNSDWGLMANLEYQTTQGDKDRKIRYDALSASGSLATDYELVQGQIKLENKQGVKIDFKTLQLLDAGLGQGITLTLDSVGYTKWQYHQLKVDYGFDITDDFYTKLSGYSTYLKEENFFQLFPPGVVLPIASDGNFIVKKGIPVTPVRFSDGFLSTPGATQTANQLALTSYYSGLEDHLIRIEFGYRHQYIDPFEKKNFGPGILDFNTVGSINIGKIVDGRLTDVTDTPHIYTKSISRDVVFISLQDEWQLASDLALTAGIRYDKYSDFGDTVNPRLALVWETAYNATTKFLYGRAFRAPSNSEQFVINNPSIIGNDALKPETIDTWEVAFDYRPTLDNKIQFNIFSYQIKDLIEIDANSIYQNSRNQEGYGYELEYHHEISEDFSLVAGFAWQHSENRVTNEETPLAPGRQLSMRANWHIANGWRATPMLHWVADRKRARNDGVALLNRSARPKIKDYTRIDLAIINNNLLPHTDFSLSVTNLFDDKKVAEPSGNAANDDYKEEGRKILMQIKYHID